MIERIRGSLRLRLAFLFAALACLLVGSTGGLLYLSTRRAVEMASSKEILDTLRVVVHRLDVDRAQPDRELLDIGDHLWIRIVDGSKRVVIQSDGMERLFPFAPETLTDQSSHWSEPGPARPGNLKALTVRRQDGWIQVLRDMEPENLVLRDFKRSLGVLLLLAPIAAASLGYAAARRGLQPLQAVVEKAGSISIDTLNQPLSLSGLPAETHPLVLALNGAMARLDEAFVRLGALNADLAHELRTPIHSIRLEAERLLAREDLPEQAVEGLEGLMSTITHLGAMAEQMLALARLEDPGLVLSREPIQAAALFELTLAPFESLAEEKQVELITEVPHGFQFRGDGTLLRRALHNLVANALQHSPEGSRISIEARNSPGEAILEVRDQGEGIPESVLAKLGQRFVRSDQSRDRRTGGMGLGLAIADRIARLHHGRLEMERHAAAGTAARICWPLDDSGHNC